MKGPNQHQQTNTLQSIAIIVIKGIFCTYTQTHEECLQIARDRVILTGKYDQVVAIVVLVDERATERKVNPNGG